MKPAETMTAVVLTGHGGSDKLVIRKDLPVPKPQTGEVLVAVGACGINNTDINTRVGWYSKSVSDGTPTAGEAGGIEDEAQHDASWGGRPIAFPRIQGADVAGRIVGVGAGVSADRMGQRVIIEPIIRDRTVPQDRNLAGYLGSERDGGFAQYTVVPAENAFEIESDLTDAELATFPCSYSTAEHMLERIRLDKSDTVLVPGASGGVGSALVQLARRRGARVLAITSSSKMEAIRHLGADAVFDRKEPDLESALRNAAANENITVVADIVGGSCFAVYLELLARGGRYVTSGAIAGPVVEMDLRTLYLKDLELQGATIMPTGIFQNLVGYIENGEIRPLLAQTFPITQISAAQEAFLRKQHIGNLVMLPWR